MLEVRLANALQSVAFDQFDNADEPRTDIDGNASTSARAVSSRNSTSHMRIYHF